MEIFRKPIDKITFEDVENFCTERIPEGILIEYKGELPSNEKIAKVVTSFANTYGGVFLIGVETDNTNRPKLPLKKIELTPGLEEKITSICFERIEPPVIPEIVSIEDPNTPGKGVIFIRIHESDTTPPHAVNGSRIYIRVNSQSHPIEEAKLTDIDNLFRKRKKAERQREFLIKRACQRSEIIFLSNDEVTLEITSIPLYPRGPIINYFEIQQVLDELKDLNNNIFLRLDFLPGNPEFQTAHQSLLILRSKNKLYFEINSFGLIWQKSVLEKFGEGADSYVPIKMLLSRILLFLLFSMYFYQQIGYWGKIWFGVKLKNVGETVFNTSGPGLAGIMRYDKQKEKEAIDNVVSIESTIPVYSCSKDSLTNTFTELAKELLWSLNAQIYAKDEFPKKEIIETIENTYGINLKC